MTPEELRPILQDALGLEAGLAAWMVLVRECEGEEVYFAVRVTRALDAQRVYEMRTAGKSWTAVMASLGVGKRTGQRLYLAELTRRRSTRQNSPESCLGSPDHVEKEALYEAD